LARKVYERTNGNLLVDLAFIKPLKEIRTRKGAKEGSTKIGRKIKE